MITVFKWLDSRFIPTDKIARHCLVNVVNPDKSELEILSGKMFIPINFLTDPLDVDERARIESEDGVLLIVLRLPKPDDTGSEIPFTTFPAGIILTKEDTIVIISSYDITEVLELDRGKVKGIVTGKRSSFVIQIFHKTALLYLQYLKEINSRTRETENELKNSLRNDDLLKILDIEKSLVYFTTALNSNELMMERLLKTELLQLTVDDQNELEDVLIDNKQAIEMAYVYSNILSRIRDAFASVISNNLNVVMRILTSITIIMMIPTLTASIYGMNIELPFQHSHHPFYIVLGITLVTSFICVLIFIKKKWI